MAYTCGRRLDGSVDNFEPSHRSVESAQLLRAVPKLVLTVA